MFRRPTKVFVPPRCTRCREPLVCSVSKDHLICPKGCGGLISDPDLWRGPLKPPAYPRMSREEFWAKYHADVLEWRESFPHVKGVNRGRFRVFTIPGHPGLSGLWRYRYVQPDHLQVLEPAPAARLLCGDVFAWSCNQTPQVRRFRRLTGAEEAALQTQGS